MLSGGVPTHDAVANASETMRIITTIIENTSIAQQDFNMLNFVHQIRPLLAVLDEKPELIHHALNHFVKLLTPSTMQTSSPLLSQLIGQEWVSVAIQFTNIFSNVPAYDLRMYPSSVGIITDDLISRSNKMNLVLSVMTNLETFISKLSSSDGSVLNVGHLCHDLTIVQKYPNIVTQLVTALKQDLGQSQVSHPINFINSLNNKK